MHAVLDIVTLGLTYYIRSQVNKALIRQTQIFQLELEKQNLTKQDKTS